MKRKPLKEDRSGSGGDYLDAVLSRKMKKAVPVQPLLHPYWTPPLALHQVEAERPDRPGNGRIKQADESGPAAFLPPERSEAFWSAIKEMPGPSDISDTSGRAKGRPVLLQSDERTAGQKSVIPDHGSTWRKGDDQDRKAVNFVEQPAAAEKVSGDRSLHTHRPWIQRDADEGRADAVTPGHPGLQPLEKPEKTKKRRQRAQPAEWGQPTIPTDLPGMHTEKISFPKSEPVAPAGDRRVPDAPQHRPPAVAAARPHVSVSIAPSPQMIPQMREPSRTIHVSIGRIEIRAGTSQPRQERVPAVARVTTLHDYLNRRKGGRR